MRPATTAERPPKQEAAERSLGGLSVPEHSTFQCEDNTRDRHIASSTDGHGRRKAAALEREAATQRAREQRQAALPVEVKLGIAQAEQIDRQQLARARRGPPTLARLRLGEVRKVFAHRYGDGGVDWTFPHDDAGHDDAGILALVAAAVPGKKHREIVRELRSRAPFLTEAEASHLVERNSGFEVQEALEADRLAEAINLTMEQRQALGIRTIGAVDFSKAQRLRLRKKKDRERKRAARAAARAALPTKEPTAPKPWVAAGLSRSTYYRQQKSSPKQQAAKPWEDEGLSRSQYYRRKNAGPRLGTKNGTKAVRNNIDIYIADATSPKNRPNVRSAQRGALPASPPQGGELVPGRDLALVFATIAPEAKRGAVIDGTGALVILRNASDDDLTLLSSEIGRSMYAYRHGPAARLPGAAALADRLADAINTIQSARMERFMMVAACDRTIARESSPATPPRPALAPSPSALVH